MTEWMDSLKNIYLRLSILLAYGPSARIIDTMRYCWDRIDHSTGIVERVIHRIFDDPRYADIPQEMKQYRPACRLSELITYDVEAINVLYFCHSSAPRDLVDQSFEEQSLRRLFRLLNLTARRLPILAVSHDVTSGAEVNANLLRSTEMRRPYQLSAYYASRSHSSTQHPTFTNSMDLGARVSVRAQYVSSSARLLTEHCC